MDSTGAYRIAGGVLLLPGTFETGVVRKLPVLVTTRAAGKAFGWVTGLCNTCTAIDTGGAAVFSQNQKYCITLYYSHTVIIYRLDSLRILCHPFFVLALAKILWRLQLVL